ncbi:MAG TPA: pyridoxal-dependent decarboxylase, partial [Bacteroidia bacterium]|nr:pyridoxal-dependent decarboxylase [Bacteroidia bacterium]
MDSQSIIEELKKLNKISSQLDISQEERASLLNQTAEYTNNFISTLHTIKGYQEKIVGNLSINNKPASLKDLLTLYQHEVAESGINAASPKHLGYIPGGGVYTAALADFIAAITNPFAGAYFAAPGAATIENEVVDWLKKVFSFPESAVGCLSSGGSVSTLIAFTAARDKFKIKNEVIPKSVVYLSEQVHHSTQKALRIIGLEDV